MSAELPANRPSVRYVVTAAIALLAGVAGGTLYARWQRSELQTQIVRLKNDADDLRRELGRAQRQAELAEERAQTAATDAAAARAYSEGLERGLSTGEPHSTAADDKPAIEPGSKTASRPAELDTEPDRCTAITRAGTRCKRKAQAGTQRCWQHRDP